MTSFFLFYNHTIRHIPHKKGKGFREGLTPCNYLQIHMTLDGRKTGMLRSVQWVQGANLRCACTEAWIRQAMTSMWASAWWRLAARRWAAGSGRTGVNLGGAEADGWLSADGWPAEDGTPAARGGRATSSPGRQAAASWLEAGGPPAELGEWRRAGH